MVRARATLLKAMVETKPRLVGSLDIAAEPADSPAAQACLRAYFSELAQRFSQGFDPLASVSADPGEVRPPAGQFLVVWSGSNARGCGAIKRIAPGIGELKRMWIHPELRGRGAGKRLLAALEESARALELHTVRLDTSAPLTEALALYRSAGYCEVAPYNANPYATHWFEKRL